MIRSLREPGNEFKVRLALENVPISDKKLQSTVKVEGIFFLSNYISSVSSVPTVLLVISGPVHQTIFLV